MEENQKKIANKLVAKIDFGAIWQAIRKYRKLYYQTLAVSFIVALIISFSLPKTYNCQILLAPETGGGSSNLGSLVSLASSFGVNIGSGSQGGDAIKPSIYPDLMKSVDFKTSLFPIKVKKKGDKQFMTYYDYLKYEWRVPWWVDLFGLMTPENKPDTLVNTFELTNEQSRIASLAIKNVECKIDKKTSLITIDVTMQDPYVAAQLADSVRNRLQDFLTSYRTQKARHDLEYALKLNKQAKKDYERARLLYSEYMDANQNMTLLTARQKQNDLENEMQLQYNNFTATSAQVLAAKALVQKETPSFTTIQSATVPLGPSGPKKELIMVVCLFLAALGTTIYALYKEHQLIPLLGLS
jgi:uncharacterized protein involved in exopolysaccharide biosynthesis